MDTKEIMDLIEKHLNSGNVRRESILNLSKKFESIPNLSSQMKENGVRNLIHGVIEFSKKEDASRYRKALGRFEKINNDSQVFKYKSYFVSTCRFFLREFDLGLDQLLKDEKSGLSSDLVYESLGFYYEQINELNKAIEYFNLSINENDKRSSLCSWGKGECFMKLGNLEEAFDAYRRSMLPSNDIVSSRAIIGMARAKKRMGLNTDALELLETELLRVNDQQSRSDLLYDKAIILYELDQNEEAIKAYRDSHNSSQDSDEKVDRLISIIDVFFELNDLDSADRVISEALCNANESTKPAVLLKSAQRQIHLNDEDAALKQLEQIRKKDIDYYILRDVLLEIAKLHAQNNRSHQATQAFSELRKKSLDIEDKEYCDLEEARFLIDQKEFTKSYALLAPLKDSNILSNKVKALFEQSRAAKEQKDFSQALSSIDTAINLCPPAHILAQCIYQKSTILTELGRKDDGINLLKQACEIYPTPSFKILSYLLQSNIQKSIGHFEEALRCLDVGLEIAATPDQKADLMIAKGILLGELGLYGNAVDIFTFVETLEIGKDKLVELFSERAHMFSTCRETKLAIDDYRKAYSISFNPKDRALYKFKEGLLTFSMNDFSAAKLLFNTAIEESENVHYLPAIFFALAICKSSEPIDIDAFDRLSKTAVGLGKDYIQLAKAYTLNHQEKSELALDCLQNIAIPDAGPLGGLRNFLLAKTLHRLGDNEKSLAALQLAEGVLGRKTGDEFLSSIDIYSFLSDLHFSDENYRLAGLYLSRAISIGGSGATRFFAIDQRTSEQLKKEKQKEVTIKGILGNEEKNKTSREDENMLQRLAQDYGKGTSKFSDEVYKSFSTGVEFGCHYTKAETALFYILPSEFNHHLGESLENISLRLNPLENVNDIEEGEFHLDPSIVDPVSIKSFESLNLAIKREMKVFCWSWTNTKFSTLTNSSAPFLIPPMWSMYGDRHSGACLVFDMEKVANYIFGPQPAAGIKRLQRVIYAYPQTQNDLNMRVAIEDLLKSGKKKFVNDFFLNTQGDILDERLNALFFKPPHWNYEKEYRLITHQEEVGPTMLSLPSSCLKGIVLGKQILPGHRKIFEKVCQKQSWFLMQYDPMSRNANDILKVIKS